MSCVTAYFSFALITQNSPLHFDSQFPALCFCYSREVEHFLRLRTALMYSSPKYFSGVTLSSILIKHFVSSLNRRSLVWDLNKQNLLVQSDTWLPNRICQMNRKWVKTCGPEQLRTCIRGFKLNQRWEPQSKKSYRVLFLPPSPAIHPLEVQLHGFMRPRSALWWPLSCFPLRTSSFPPITSLSLSFHLMRMTNFMGNWKMRRMSCVPGKVYKEYIVVYSKVVIKHYSPLGEGINQKEPKIN